MKAGRPKGSVYRDPVIHCLVTHSGELKPTRGEIARALGCSENSIKPVLEQLIKEKIVNKPETKKDRSVTGEKRTVVRDVVSVYSLNADLFYNVLNSYFPWKGAQNIDRAQQGRQAEFLASDFASHLFRGSDLDCLLARAFLKWLSVWDVEHLRFLRNWISSRKLQNMMESVIQRKHINLSWSDLTQDLVQILDWVCDLKLKKKEAVRAWENKLERLATDKTEQVDLALAFRILLNWIDDREKLKFGAYLRVSPSAVRFLTEVEEGSGISPYPLLFDLGRLSKGVTDDPQTIADVEVFRARMRTEYRRFMQRVIFISVGSDLMHNSEALSKALRIKPNLLDDLDIPGLVDEVCLKHVQSPKR